MVRKTASLHDWMTESAASGLWRQPPGTRRVTSTTYERAQKRQEKAFWDDWSTFANHRSEGPDKREDIFNKIVEKVKKKHPEMKNIKARRYARTQDPLGRKFQRLKNQGYGAEYIAKKLGYKNGKFKASSGHSGG